ncbi:methyl-accepting chemotaxis protein [Rubrivivax sp. A210]|uniref:methyl-accepting chemotaxis protein n=1 Tax=Rubrivivax sp. A210 TaxID=2772301 RepID=UPI001919C977|nr:methyl-accepting chemotaxis protein [Rubrivivax sp. A210]
MNISHLKVRTRLGIAFGTLLLLTSFMAGLAVYKLADIESNLEDVVNDNNVKLQHSHDMSESVHIVARVMRTMALMHEKSEKDAELAKIKQARADYDKAWTALVAMPAVDAMRAGQARIAKTLEATRAINARFIEAAMADKTDEAVALLKESIPLNTSLQDELHNYVKAEEADTAAVFKEAQADYASGRNLVLGSALFAFIAAAGLGMAVTRSITRQLGGEPGEAAELARRVAEGDLGSRFRLAAGDTSSMMAQLQRMQDSLARVVGDVRMNAENVATASAQIAQGNSDLSSRTEQQAAALEQTAATMDELGSTVRSNADSARQANQLAQGASTVAVKGGAVVGEAVETMKGINESSRKIADIIGVIDGIAFQTNILALNAAVEAARAGEEGRGFAVVAGEVRSLAQRSAEAARQIKSLIAASVESVERGSAQVNQAGATMSEVVDAIRRVTDIVGEITSASVEQSSGVAQVGEAVSQMDKATQQNAALVEESAAAAESLRQQAQQLVQTVSVFKIEGAAASARPAMTVAVSRPAQRPSTARPARTTPAAIAAAAVNKAAEESWETF